MGKRVSERYRKAAEEFSRRIVAELGGEIDAIVLYGSVARGEARKDSDIDILIVSQNPAAIRERVSEIRSDFTYERNYEFLISLIHRSRDDLYRFGQAGSPLIAEVAKDGEILYDNGTFGRLRQQAARVG